MLLMMSRPYFDLIGQVVNSSVTPTHKDVQMGKFQIFCPTHLYPCITEVFCGMVTSHHCLMAFQKLKLRTCYNVYSMSTRCWGTPSLSLYTVLWSHLLVGFRQECWSGPIRMHWLTQYIIQVQVLVSWISLLCCILIGPFQHSWV